MDRLSCIKSLVPKGSVVVDLGTDHCKIPNALVKEGFKPVYATEASKGPLEQAKRNALDGVTLSLHDGLLGFEEPVDTVIIAGMGGDLIIKILRESFSKFRGMKQMILQPMQQIEHLRTFLMDHDFFIDREEIVREGQKYYQIFRVKNGKEEAYDPRFFKTDTSDIELLKSYYQKEANRINHLLSIREKEEDREHLQGLKERL